MDKEKIEKIIAEKLNEYEFELPKDEYELVAEELAESIVKNCSIPAVIKSVCEHRPISLGRMIQCDICGKILSSF